MNITESVINDTVEKLNALAERSKNDSSFLDWENDAIHETADDCLLEFIEAIGCKEVTQAYQNLKSKIEFYYS